MRAFAVRLSVITIGAHQCFSTKRATPRWYNDPIVSASDTYNANHYCRHQLDRDIACVPSPPYIYIYIYIYMYTVYGNKPLIIRLVLHGKRSPQPRHVWDAHTVRIISSDCSTVYRKHLFRCKDALKTDLRILLLCLYLRARSAPWSWGTQTGSRKSTIQCF